MWLRAFAGAVGPPPVPADGVISQTVAGAAGGNYSFSAWSFWEANYVGDSQTFPTTTTDTIMRIEFLDNADMPIAGSTQTLDVDLGPDGLYDGDDPSTGTVENNPLDGQANDSTWRQFTIAGTAPAGTVSVRVTAAGLQMLNSGASPQSAFFDDFSLDGPEVIDIDPDLDMDGDVDGADILLIQRGLGTTTTGAFIDAWKSGFASAVVAAGAVPEPTSGAMALAIALLGLNYRRKQAS
jgi:hypothetical protein